MKVFWRLFAVAAFGALIYGGIEVVGRGYTHISMGLLGAASMVVIHELNGERREGRLGTGYAIIVSMLFITAGELLTGEILNRRLDMDIWDYNDQPLNFDGQICLLYSVFWLLLSLCGMVADDLMRRIIFCEKAGRVKDIAA